MSSAGSLLRISQDHMEMAAGLLALGKQLLPSSFRLLVQFISLQLEDSGPFSLLAVGGRLDLAQSLPGKNSITRAQVEAKQEEANPSRLLDSNPQNWALFLSYRRI